MQQVRAGRVTRWRIRQEHPDASWILQRKRRWLPGWVHVGSLNSRDRELAVQEALKFVDNAERPAQIIDLQAERMAKRLRGER